MAQAAVRGVMKQFNGDMYAVYPADGNNLPFPSLNYAFLDGGAFNTNNVDEEILYNSTPLTPTPIAWTDLSQVGLDFELDSSGGYTLAGGLPIPVISFMVTRIRQSMRQRNCIPGNVWMME